MRNTFCLVVICTDPGMAGSTPTFGRGSGDPTYSWIRLIFVPASCTPVGQPMDAGIIAKAKGVLRRFYGAWVIKLVQGKFDGGAKPEGGDPRAL
jgi:hypothetical protein